jgi:DNA-directed RNA polymerase specialized sigma24 family protein
MAAADVARLVGWPDAKAVYNRVYRALATLRAELGREGIGSGDL